MKKYFADLHIHVGMSEEGQWIKIPTSRNLTVRNILTEAALRKGIDIIGIVDAISPAVQKDLQKLVAEGQLSLIGGGGYNYNNRLTLLLGAEIETTEEHGGTAHTIIFLPDLQILQEFSAYMAQFIRNINLSSQNAHMSLAKLVRIATQFSAVIIPAHVFTPHKSIYGNCAKRLGNLLDDRDMANISAIELGLSADSNLADRIAELASFTFLTNSDAHSPDKIAREYNILAIQEPSFQECTYAFARKNGRYIGGNYGLDPRLGKYHRSSCLVCGYVTGEDYGNMLSCPLCQSESITMGVLDRINSIADYEIPVHPEHRPAYCYQIPLQFIPGIGRKKLDKLLGVFGNEMNILHKAEEKQIAETVGASIARQILDARLGLVSITPGGGGVYGRLS